jgi:hypothetical protein
VRPALELVCTSRSRADSILTVARGAGRRSRKVDPTHTWEIGNGLEEILGHGFHLAHTHRMGWLLRKLESSPDPTGKPRMKWVDVDSAPDGQLGALLIRHQQRDRQES